MPTSAAIEAMFTIAPPPLRRSDGAEARIPKVGTGEIDIEDALPRRQRAILDQDGRARNPCIVHQHGKRSEPLLCRRDRCGPVFLLGDVEMHLECLIAELGGQRLACLVPNIADDDIRAL